MSKNAQINWENLRHFLVLAEKGSLSRAARHLDVEHTTVSRRITALEGELGLKLIERLPRSIHLTEEGKQISQLGIPLEETVFAILRAASAAQPDVTGPVRISAPPAFAAQVLAPRLAPLAADHPGLLLTLLGDAGTVNLNHRHADISLRLSRPTEPDLIARKLGEMAFGFYASLTYNRHEEDWSFIGYDDSSSTIPQHAWLESFRAGRDTVLQTNDSTSQATAARSGIGVALIPCFIGDADPELKRLSASEIFPPREIWILVHDDLRHTPRIRVVMEALERIITRL